MKKILIIATSLLLFVGIFVVTSNSKQKSKDAFLSRYNLQTETIKNTIEYLDGSEIKPVQLGAQITSEALVMNDGKENHTFSTKDEDFYLSFAPYQYNTHPCFDHIPIGCQGEMINTEVEVIVYDEKGNVVYSGTETTATNGFAGIWLPRNIKGTITVKYDDQVAVSDFGTYKTDGTCLTTLQLV